jgi:hypothetical protein
VNEGDTILLFSLFGEEKAFRERHDKQGYKKARILTQL